MSRYLQEEENTQMYAGFFQPDTFKKKKQQIKVLETSIAGMGFHVKDDAEQDNLKKLTPGTELKLFREPKNEYDQWAVAIYLDEDDLIGYLTRYKNETIARLMDCGKQFKAVVDEKREETDMNREGRTPTESGVPISVYMIEG